MPITYKNFNRLASRIAPSGNSYELQEITLEQRGRLIPHPDGEQKHYRVVILSADGLFLSTKDFKADAKKANEWMINQE